MVPQVRVDEIPGSEMQKTRLQPASSSIPTKTAVHGNNKDKDKDQQQQLQVRKKGNGIVGRKEQAIMHDNGHSCRAKEQRQPTAIPGTEVWTK